MINPIALVLATLISLTGNYTTNHKLNVQQSYCLAEAVYFESRGEPLEGQIAVAHVILNRAKASKTTICQVVHAKHQFTFYSNKSRQVREAMSWKLAAEVAVYSQLGWFSNPVKNANMFNTGVNTQWKHVVKIRTIGHHSFYARLTTDSHKSGIQKQHTNVVRLAHHMTRTHQHHHYNNLAHLHPLEKPANDNVLLMASNQ